MKATAKKSPDILLRIKKALGNQSENEINTAFSHALKQLYWAEQFLATNLPEFVEGASSKPVADCMDGYYARTLMHAQNLRQIFNLLQLEVEEEECESMYGLTDEVTDWFMDLPEKTQLRDLLIISSAIKINLYEVTCYRTLYMLATAMGLTEVVAVILPILEEVKKFGTELAKLGDLVAAKPWLSL